MPEPSIATSKWTQDSKLKTWINQIIAWSWSDGLTVIIYGPGPGPVTSIQQPVRRESTASDWKLISQSQSVSSYLVWINYSRGTRQSRSIKRLLSVWKLFIKKAISSPEDPKTTALLHRDLIWAGLGGWTALDPKCNWDCAAHCTHNFAGMWNLNQNCQNWEI